MEDEILQKLCINISSNKLSAEDVKKELEKISNRGRSEWREHSPLISAVKVERKDLIKLMVKDLGFDIDSIRKYTSPKVANNFESVLSQAIRINNEDMVRFLVVEMKAKVNTNKCWFACPSPLTYAILHNRLQIVKLLVEELGADVNFKVSQEEDGSDPFLALHEAICKADQRLVFS
jgi:hypothetical protein